MVSTWKEVGMDMVITHPLALHLAPKAQQFAIKQLKTYLTVYKLNLTSVAVFSQELISVIP